MAKGSPLYLLMTQGLFKLQFFLYQSRFRTYSRRKPNDCPQTTSCSYLTCIHLFHKIPALRPLVQLAVHFNGILRFQRPLPTVFPLSFHPSQEMPEQYLDSTNKASARNGRGEGDCLVEVPCSDQVHNTV